MRRRTALPGLAAALLLVPACDRAPASGPPASGPPARLVAGRSDTLIVHERRAVRIAVRVLDGAGRVLPDAGVGFAWASGDSVAVSPHGDATCVRTADAVVRATLGRMSTRLLLRCRPVETLRFAGPIQLVLGDTARVVPVMGYGPDDRPVALLDGRVSVGDTGLVALDGLRVRPRRAGASVLTVHAGDRHATTGLHVYEPAAAVDGLARAPRPIAVPLRLAPGEMRRWPLPWGGWLLSMWPAEDSLRGLRLRVEGASCMPASQIGPRHHLCYVADSATVVVYAPWRAERSPPLAGTLAIKPSGPTRRAAR